jgi:hypothetical protein
MDLAMAVIAGCLALTIWYVHFSARGLYSYVRISAPGTLSQDLVGLVGFLGEECELMFETYISS